MDDKIGHFKVLMIIFVKLNGTAVNDSIPPCRTR